MITFEKPNLEYELKVESIGLDALSISSFDTVLVPQRKTSTWRSCYDIQE